MHLSESHHHGIHAMVNLASYPGHVSEGKVAWYPLFAHARKPNDFMGYRIPSFTNRSCVNLYRTAPKHGRLKLGLVNSEDFDEALKFGLCCIGKGYFTLKAEQLDAIKCISMVKTYSCGSHGIILGSLSATRLCRLFSTRITVTVKLAVVVA